MYIHIQTYGHISKMLITAYADPYTSNVSTPVMCLPDPQTSDLLPGERRGSLTDLFAAFICHLFKWNFPAWFTKHSNHKNVKFKKTKQTSFNVILAV